MQVLESNGSKGACLGMREIVTLSHLFFLFKVSCTSLQISPLHRSSLLTAQMARPGGVHVLFMVSLIKNYFFPIFHPKMRTIALQPMVTLKSYNFGIIKDTYKMVGHQTGFFRISQFNGVT